MRPVSLQTRTVLTLLAILLPLLTLFTTYRIIVEARTRHTQRLERVITRIDANSEALCRARRRLPRRLERQLRGLKVHVYQKDMTPVLPRTPPLPAPQREQLRALSGDEIFMHQDASLGAPPMPDFATHGYTLARIGEQQQDAGCAYMLIPWPKPHGAITRNIVAIVLPQSLFLATLLLLSGLIISVPLVRRIKRLTRDVERAHTQNTWRLEETSSYGKDELGQLANAFDAAGIEIQSKIAELEERDVALKEYISNTTHDLAIPLTVIQHRLQRIQAASRREEPAPVELVHGAMEESMYIAALIANMAAMAKLDVASAHTLTREAVDLNEVVERVVGRHEPIAEPQHIELVWSVPEHPLHTRGDSTLIERALSNLVQNAIQYNDHGGHVAIILEALDEERFCLTVLDDGPGVVEEQLARLGQRAVRGDDARNRNPGGQGFGLSIVHKVCALHDWTLAFSHASDQSETKGLQVRIQGNRIKS